MTMCFQHLAASHFSTSCSCYKYVDSIFSQVSDLRKRRAEHPWIGELNSHTLCLWTPRWTFCLFSPKCRFMWELLHVVVWLSNSCVNQCNSSRFQKYLRAMRKIILPDPYSTSQVEKIAWLSSRVLLDETTSSCSPVNCTCVSWRHLVYQKDCARWMKTQDLKELEMFCSRDGSLLCAQGVVCSESECQDRLTAMEEPVGVREADLLHVAIGQKGWEDGFLSNVEGDVLVIIAIRKQNGLFCEARSLLFKWKSHVYCMYLSSCKD